MRSRFLGVFANGELELPTLLGRLADAPEFEDAQLGELGLEAHGDVAVLGVLRSWQVGLEANLPTAQNAQDGYVPVRFQSKLTELGVFELWCISQAAEQRWKLEFSVREDAEKA